MADPNVIEALDLIRQSVVGIQVGIAVIAVQMDIVVAYLSKRRSEKKRI